MKAGEVGERQPRVEQDLNLWTLTGKSGKFRIAGKEFEITDMGSTDTVTVSQSPDASFSRIKILAGEMTGRIKDSAGKLKAIPLTAGWVVKIWMTRASDRRSTITTILLTKPDGSLTEAITYNIPAK